MRIVCSTNMPFAAEAFGTLGDVEIMEGRRITAAAVRECDLLAVRSTTRVDRTLLRGSRVRFVGTATIGIDHLDTEFLGSEGIHWCYAPGCNANSVSEYVVAALSCLAERDGLRLADTTIGVIGAGNVGGRVARKAAALGMRVLINDPPRARAGDDEDFQPLELLLEEADILSLHVPLNADGPDKTLHLADRRFFEMARPGLVLINASRGAVVRGADLLDALRSGRVSRAVIDTWENEPAISRELLAGAALGTPHIAGHSFEGKVEGTMMVYRAACRFLGKPPVWDPAPHLPPAPVPRFDPGAADDANLQATVRRTVRAVYDIEADDRRLRAVFAGDARESAAAFDDLRRNYPQRREFRFTRVPVPENAPLTAACLRNLGFVVAAAG